MAPSTSPSVSPSKAQGTDLAAEHRFGERARPGLRVHVPVSTMRRSRRVMMSTPMSVQAPPIRIFGVSTSPSSITLKMIENTGESVVSGATLVTG